MLGWRPLAEKVMMLSEGREFKSRSEQRFLKALVWRLHVRFLSSYRLIKSEFKINNVVIENVKSIKYLGFTRTAKNCSFLPTLEDLSIKANRAIYTLNTKSKSCNIHFKH